MLVAVVVFVVVVFIVVVFFVVDFSIVGIVVFELFCVFLKGSGGWKDFRVVKLSSKFVVDY